MIASIDCDCDLSIYLNQEEINQLSEKNLEGILVKLNMPKKQGKIFISLNQARSDEQGYAGIGVYDKNYFGRKEEFEVEVFLSDYVWGKIREIKSYGGRQGMRDGSKINLYNISHPDADIMLKHSMENLHFYVENKDKLLDIFGRPSE